MGEDAVRLSRVWAMPTADTFDCLPIGGFVKRYLDQSTVSIDPFARNKLWATHTNDLNTETLSGWVRSAAMKSWRLCLCVTAPVTMTLSVWQNARTGTSC